MITVKRGHIFSQNALIVLNLFVHIKSDELNYCDKNEKGVPTMLKKMLHNVGILVGSLVSEGGKHCLTIS